MSLAGIVVPPLLVVLVVLVVGRPFRDVTRARLERFALRQALLITAGNGPRVIAYLATTRRWRGGLLLLSLVLAEIVAAAQHSGASQLNGLAGFIGWFVGAVVAEWRVGGRGRDGVRRAASLVPRRLGDYLPRWLAGLVVGAFVAVLAFDGWVLVSTDGNRWEPSGLLLLTLATAAVIAAVARHVLTRPQALASDDVVAADDALRSRSLHVLLGSGLALAGYLLSLGGGIAARDTTWAGEQWPSVLTALGILLLPVLGVVSATAPFRASVARSGVGAAS